MTTRAQHAGIAGDGIAPYGNAPSRNSGFVCGIFRNKAPSYATPNNSNNIMLFHHDLRRENAVEAQTTKRKIPTGSLSHLQNPASHPLLLRSLGVAQKVLKQNPSLVDVSIMFVQSKSALVTLSFEFHWRSLELLARVERKAPFPSLVTNNLVSLSFSARTLNLCSPRVHLPSKRFL